MPHLYFDHAASAPLDPRVKTAMIEALNVIGNPSSIHTEGQAARRLVDRAREQVARLLEVQAGEIVFTSGASESNNLAVRGIVAAARRRHPGRRFDLLISPLEHSSVSETAAALEEEELVRVVTLPVGADGRVSPEAVAEAVTPETLLVAVMWASNILGTVQPVPEIGRVIEAVRERRGTSGLPLYFLSDAVQAVGARPVRPKPHGVDLFSFSGHKIGGPKGVGVLFVRRGTPLEPVLTGGGQEAGLRSGTENVIGIVGLGAAAEIVGLEREADAERIAGLRGRFIDGLKDLSRWRVLSPAKHVLPGIVFLRHEKVPGDELVIKLDARGIAVSSGSACDAGHRRRSAAIEAVFGPAMARQGGIRVSLGRTTTEGDIDRLLAELAAV